MMLGLTTINTSELNRPVARPHHQPFVVNRFQKIDRTSAGRLADAATAKARATKNATLKVGPSTMAIAIDAAPTVNAVIRATRTSSPGERSVPLCSTLVQKSCAKEVDALIVSPATTASMVAKAMDEMKAKNTSPARRWASSGALMLVPPCVLLKPDPTMVAAPKPRKVVMM